MPAPCERLIPAQKSQPVHLVCRLALLYGSGSLLRELGRLPFAARRLCIVPAQQLFPGIRRRADIFPQSVGVDIHGGGGLCVAQPGGDGLDILMGADEQRGVVHHTAVFLGERLRHLPVIPHLGTVCCLGLTQLLQPFRQGVGGWSPLGGSSWL